MLVKYIIGIDEAGRGPLAGPVAVGAVCVGVNFKKSFLKGIKDSKGLSEKQREEWFRKIIEEMKRGWLSYKVSFVSARVIDKQGISKAVSKAIVRTLTRLNVSPKQVKIFLDGSLYAPKEFTQKTIIRGDETIPLISLASVIVKVLRDRRMKRYAKRFPLYKLEVHKGYGTELHRKLIKKHGPSELHRLSFLKNIL
ncbi:MAG: ribonuclease HII [Candidatus Pacebacteria bacterium]|nr:ribonuclease HII [Candidatus Paceibacterota bacterium]